MVIASNTGHCLVNLNWAVYKVWGTGQGGENRPKCPAVGSLFPHPCLLQYQLLLSEITNTDAKANGQYQIPILKDTLGLFQARVMLLYGWQLL